MSSVGTAPASSDFERVSLFTIGTEYVVKEKEGGLAEELIPVDIDFKIEVSKKNKFLSFAGVWKHLDTEKMKEEIVRLRKRSSRSIEKL